MVCVLMRYEANAYYGEVDREGDLLDGQWELGME